MPENFFTTDYLFSTTAPTNDVTFYALLGFFVAFIILAILISLSKKMHRPLRAWLFNYFLTIGIVGVSISLFRQQSIRYLGTRFMMLFVIVATVIWYLALVGYTLFIMPKEVKRNKDEEKFQKYLPKKKR